MVNQAEKLIAENKYLMLSKTWCPDCHYAIAVFRKYGVLEKVKMVELDKMDAKEAFELEKQFTAISGRKWVPTIFFNGERFGTEQDLARLESLDQTESEFKKAGLK